MYSTTAHRPRLRSLAIASAVTALFATLPNTGPAWASDGFTEEEQSEDSTIPSPGVLDQMMEQGAAVAQFTCTVKETALYGMSAMGRREGPPIDMDVTLTETGVAIVNGQAIQPTETRPRTLGAGDGAIESALYPMEEVRRALTGPAFQLPSTGFSSDEQRQLEGFGGILNGMMDGMTAGRNRHMMVTLEQNSVGFFDIAAGNRVANAQVASCYRTR